jgi:hypothetical protein
MRGSIVTLSLFMGGLLPICCALAAAADTPAGKDTTAREAPSQLLRQEVRGAADEISHLGDDWTAVSRRIALAGKVERFRALDIDRDRDIDLVAVTRDENGHRALVTIIKERPESGEGQNWTVSCTPLSKLLGEGEVDLRIGDLNGDTQPDIILLGGKGAVIATGLHQGDGVWKMARQEVKGSTPIAGVLLLDFDGDEFDDLLLVRSDGRMVGAL